MQKMLDNTDQGLRSLEMQHLTLIWAYNALQLFGFISVVAVFFTAVASRSVRRSMIWYIFMLGWIIWCISYLLLIGQQTGTPPARALCTFQAALIYAGPPANACATLGILLRLYLSVSSILKHHGIVPRWKILVVNTAPPVVWVAIFAGCLIYGIVNPLLVHRDLTGMYCNMSSAIPSGLSAALVALFSLVMIIYEVITFFLLYHNWSAFRRLQISTPTQAASITMILRISIFSVLPMLALGLCVHSTLSSASSGGSNIATAVLPGAAGLIFGTQKDILDQWAFWKAKPKVIPKHEIDAHLSSEKAV
ncbi:hypothetical protein VKT23_017317 [Stygiomarasmius scandens]|uniref:Uncharacterized protein n=1 Tax=Marasmiellus scandens TaxID=2682957 RepID=A0ABR1ISM2_9AGAR